MGCDLMLKLGVAFVVLAWTQFSHAEVGPPGGSYQLKALFDASDAVCVGTVVGLHNTVSTTQAQPPAASLVSKAFGLSVARCYKGAVEPTDVIGYTTHEPVVSLYDMPLANGDYALYFLKRLDAGSLALADRFWGRLHDATLQLLAPPELSGLAQLETDVLLNLPAIAEPQALSEELLVLRGFEHLAPAIVAAVRPYVKDLDRRVATAAFSALAKNGAPDDLAALCQYAQDPALDSFAADYGFNLGEIRNRAARPALECLARTPVRTLKYGAMQAIRAIKSPASVPELVRRLDDPDPNIQFLAYMSLCEIVHRKGDPGEGASGFARDRDAIVAAWKQWWGETGRIEYPER
jgi:hypothetical protein